MKQTLKYAAVAAAMLAAQSASATTVSITYDGAAAGFRSGTIDEIDVALAGGTSDVVAGGFNMIDSTPGGLGSFLAFCLDLGAYLSASGPEEYILTDTPFQNGSEPILASRPFSTRISATKSRQPLTTPPRSNSRFGKRSMMMTWTSRPAHFRRPPPAG